MRYRIEFRPAALRQFTALPRTAQEKIKPVIDAPASNPRPPGVKQLKGRRETLYRIKAGPGERYRIIYQVRDEVLLILVVLIADRKEACRALP